MKDALPRMGIYKIDYQVKYFQFHLNKVITSVKLLKWPDTVWCVPYQIKVKENQINGVQNMFVVNAKTRTHFKTEAEQTALNNWSLNQFSILTVTLYIFRLFARKWKQHTRKSREKKNENQRKRPKWNYIHSSTKQ